MVAVAPNQTWRDEERTVRTINRATTLSCVLSRVHGGLGHFLYFTSLLTIDDYHVCSDWLSIR